MDSEVPGVNLRHSPRVGRQTMLVVLVTALLGVVLAVFGIVSRQQAVANLKQVAADRAVPAVETTAPAPRNAGATIELPGRLEAYARAALFARVSGYIAKWHADIGMKVKAGEVLAEIEAPDLDQQLSQAQSDLANAQANEQLANVTNQRYQALLPNAIVSRQTADEKAADLTAKRAVVRSQEAYVARLQALAQYKRVVAPFDGVVTARNTDVGALINAGSVSGSELFVVSDTKRLRLYVSIPQSFLGGIVPGAAARLIVPERPGKSYAARVEAGSGAIDPATGTMRTQLVVENPNGELIPGSFATVHFHVTGEAGYFTVPASVVIFDKGGLRVAIVSADGTIAFRKITIARDLGNTIEISSGLAANDRVVQSPPDDLREGDQVTIKESLVGR
jgi:membrane fusion protein, multidrug efflux system